eukprot:TRINITY_DN1156_c0_g1_i1.p1 TRINITY_DN1156_c0_g1~~TRINITY_DN1156_c0_g1_i1.p1  ORF type:complete len:332 (-),score=66.29 TRINITY_DN1156_c0_g1_i1:42-1037(-)
MQFQNLFFWTDVECLSALKEPEDIAERNKEICANYLDILEISSRDKAELKKKVLANPQDKSTFQNTSKAILTQYLNDPDFHFVVQNFVQAVLYRRRYHKEDSNLPNEVFERAVVEATDEYGWSVVGKGISRKNDDLYDGFYWRESFEIDTDFDTLAEAIWSLKCENYMHKDVKMIENMGDDAHVLYFRLSKKIFVQKRHDILCTKFRRRIDDDTIVILGCSIDHVQAPISSKVKRMFCDLNLAYLKRKPNGMIDVVFINMVRKNSVDYVTQLLKYDMVLLQSARKPIIEKVLTKNRKNTLHSSPSSPIGSRNTYEDTTESDYSQFSQSEDE